MSKLITENNILSRFPEALANNAQKFALASVIATELVELYEDNQFLVLYSRIDELDEDLLDILAYDFKVDWWDNNYSLLEKRSLFKNIWIVHRVLGTPGAVKTAISSIYKNVKLQEWWEYGGKPHYFKLLIDTGNMFFGDEKLQSIISRVRFYKNLRSLIEIVECLVTKETKTYIGVAIHSGTTTQLTVVDDAPNDNTWLVDENDDYLLDENGILLFE